MTSFVLRQSLAFLNVEGIDETSVDATDYFRWQHGLQSGRPVKKLFLPWTESELGVSDIWYHSRRLFYRTFAANDLEMMDLVTGERSKLVKEEELNADVEILISDCHVIVHDHRYEDMQFFPLVRII